MKNSPENELEPVCKINKNLSQISPTTSTILTSNLGSNLRDKKLPTKFNRTRVTLDYPLCNNLLNEHLFHADFYSGLGPLTINTEWLV